MMHHDLIDLQTFKIAFLQNINIVLFVVFLQIFLCFLTVLRYNYIIKIFDISINFLNVTAATFVSNGLGLWLPGSMAFIEVIRVSLMIGAKGQQEFKEQKNMDNDLSVAEVSLRSRLTTASLLDRLVGLWAMLFIGLMTSGYFILKQWFFQNNHSNIFGLLSLFCFIFILIILISVLPFVSQSSFFLKCLYHVERIFLSMFRKGFAHEILKKLFFELNGVFSSIALVGSRMKSLLVPLVYSFICVFIQCFSIYFSGIAIFKNIPFVAILSTVSILNIATLLPLGFAGVGGAQVIAAVCFSFFAVSPQAASSAQLLQTALNLFALSFAALFFIHLSWKQLNFLFKRS